MQEEIPGTLGPADHIGMPMGYPAESSDGSEPTVGDYDYSTFDLTDFVSNHDHMDMFPQDQQQQPDASNVFQSQSQDSHPAQSDQLRDHNGLRGNNSTNGALHHPSAGQPHENISYMPSPSGSDATEVLKEHLAKQIQLQQIQQMQNHLLQQQINIISGGTPGATFDPNRLNGSLQLPTPRLSTEIPPTVHRDFMSPMLLQASNGPTFSTLNEINQAIYSLMSPAMSVHPHQAMTAPAAVAFPNTGYHTPNLDHLSPLTSPALGPVAYGSEYFQQPSTVFPPAPNSGGANTQQQSASRPKAKRRSSVDEPMSRKRPSPLVGPVTRRNARELSSRANSGTATSSRTRATTARSPVLLSSTSPFLGAIPTSINDSQHAQNTPSPVDLSMPPPAPPSRGHSQQSSTTSSPFLAAVTPGSIMNMGSLSSFSTGLVPQGTQASSGQSSPTPIPSYSNVAQDTMTAGDKEGLAVAEATQSPTNAAPKRGGKGKGAASAKRSKSSSVSSSSTPIIAPVGSSKSKTAGNVNGRGFISPNLKAIRPNVSSAEAVAHLASKSNYQNILEGRGEDLGISFPQEGQNGVHGRKHSHKDAEQKRRDSLKAGFDDLRLLLPPITNDFDPDSAEPPVPGSNPPRGPARNVPGVEDHPNRHVSKLALLRSSNEYIVKLKRRVDRRDMELEKMRHELKAMRLELGISPDEKERNGMTLMDIDRDIDAIERDGAEERAGKAAARPTELALAMKLATIVERDAAGNPQNPTTTRVPDSGS